MKHFVTLFYRRELSLHSVTYLQLVLEIVLNRGDQCNKNVDECLPDNYHYTGNALELGFIASLDRNLFDISISYETHIQGNFSNAIIESPLNSN